MLGIVAGDNKEPLPRHLAETLPVEAADSAAIVESADTAAIVESADTPATVAAATASSAATAAAELDSAATVASSPAGVGDDSIAEGLEQGTRLDRFVVVEKLGEGGMGVVIAAYDPDLDRKVAIKLLRSGAWNTGVASEGRQRLLREAQAMAKLSHPNVVVVHGVGTMGSQVYIAMEYVDGCTLGKWLKEEKRSWRQIVAMFCRAGRGLVAAHAAGLIHRDFKPDNVLVGKDGRVRVTDFGIVGTAGSVDEGEGRPGAGPMSSRSTPLSTPLTSAGVLLGTPIYMAPEQLERAPVDASADQFSFCVALYEALYGERPFAGKSYDELSRNVSSGNFRSPRAEVSVPSWLRTVVRKGLRADPRERYPSMEALIADLENDPAVARRRRLTIAGLVVAFVLLAAMAVVGLVRGSRVDDPRERCRRNADEGLAEVWNERRSSELERAFTATAQPYFGESLAGTSTIVGKYAEDIVATRIEACEATHVRGEQSETMLGRRQRCLARRISQLAALMDGLLGQTDATVLERAVAAATRLSPVSACSDLDALAEAVEPPAAKLAAAVDALHSRVDRVRVLAGLGQAQAAHDEAKAVVAAAGAIDYRPLQAVVLHRLGVAQLGIGATADAEATLRAAVQAAAQAKDDRLVADTWIWLVEVVGMQSDRLDEAMALQATADAAVARAGDYPIDRARLQATLARVLVTQGKPGEASAQQAEAIALLEQATAPTDLRVADYLVDHGRLLVSQGDHRAAAERFEKAHSIRERALGSRHPATARAAFELARASWLSGDHGEREVALTEQARQVFAASANHERDLAEVDAWVRARLR